MLAWLVLTSFFSGAAPAVQGAHPLELRLELDRAQAAHESAGRANSGPGCTLSLIRAADLAEALGHLDRAAAALLMLADRLPADPRSPGWRLRAAAWLHSWGRHDGTRAALLPLLERDTKLRPTGAERARALLLLGRTDAAVGRVGRARERFAEVIAAWAQAADADRLALSAVAAEAAFGAAELEARRLRFDPPPSMAPERLGPWFKLHLAAFGKAVAAFERVLPHGDMRWSARALLARARLLVKFQRWLLSFPPPPGLSPEQLEAYHQALEDQGSSFEGQAVAQLQGVIRLVAEYHLEADSGRLARETLQQLEPRLRWWQLRRPALPAPLPIEPGHPRWLKVMARLSQAPGDPEALLLAAEAYLVDQRPMVAVYVLRRLVPPSTEQRLLLVRALMLAEEPARAYAHACALTRDQPGLLTAWRLRAELEFVFGDLSGADRTLSQLAELAPGPAGLRASQAVIRVGRGELAQARRILEALVMAEPGRPGGHYDLALVLMATGRAEHDSLAERTALVRRAASHLERADELTGQCDPDIAEHRKRAAATLRAIEAFESEARPLAPSREEL